MMGEETEALPRSVALEGASNMRDLGGYPTGDGRRVRFGRLYRGAALNNLTEADEDVLRGLGLRTVCDLRGTRETAQWPTRLGGVRIARLPIEPTVGASLRDLAATERATGEDAMGVMRRAYEAYVSDCGAQYAALIGEVLSADGPPLLFHCSAGKDRTGFGAALILRLVGVSMDDARADYLATNRLWRGDSALAAELPAAMAAVLLRVHGELLDAAFAAVEARGGLPGYAREVLGLDAGAVERLRAVLVE